MSNARDPQDDPQGTPPAAPETTPDETELADDSLDAVSGGAGWAPPPGGDWNGDWNGDWQEPG